jgi:trigger factor
LKITTESTGERQISLTIEVGEERVERARRRTARQISREVDIPGFRKGKAPYEVVVQRFGEEVFRQELMNHLAPDIYREALEEAELIAYGPGTLEDTAFDPMTLTFTVPLIPQVDLGDYREYRLEVSDVEVPEDELGEALEGVRERNAVLAPLDRPAAEGDLLVGELVGRTIEGAEFLHEEEARILLDPEDEHLLPGLLDALIGLEEGEERTFTLVLPEGFQIEELAGQEVVFEAYVEHVYERILPDLDDDLARTVGNYDSFEELKASVRQRLEEKERAEIESDYAEHVLQGIIAQAEVSYPEVMLEEALDEVLESRKRQIERSEHMMLEDYLRIQGKTVDELREEMKPEMEASLVRSLVLGEVVKQEGLEVSDEALDIQIAESSEQYGERAEEVRAALRDPEMREDVRNRMLANRALERLVTIAKGELPEGHEADEVTDEEEAEEASEA